MGKHKGKRHLISRIPPHRGSVILTERVSLPTTAELMKEAMVHFQRPATMTDTQLAMACMMTAIRTSTMVPLAMLGRPTTK
jgi:hypothetical protein